MKILLIGDYSNFHNCLASELRRKGHSTTLISDRGRYMNTDADIYLPRTPGVKGGISYLYRLFNLLPELKGYDVVQLINTNFLALRPGRIKYFYDIIRRQNGSVFLTLAGDDYFYLKECRDGNLFRYSEIKVGENPTDFYKQCPRYVSEWLSEPNRKLAEHIYDTIDGAMSVLPEYDIAARPLLQDKLAFTNIPIDLSSIDYKPLDLDGQIKLFIGMKSGMEIEKGTECLSSLAMELEKEMPDKVRVETVKDLSLSEYLMRMSGSHIVLDQLYAYSPATNALQAMAMGKVAGSGAQPEYYEYIGNPVEHPVLSLSPLDNDIKDRLRKFILDPSPLHEMSRQGRILVEKNNEAGIVADRFIMHWERCLDKKQ